MIRSLVPNYFWMNCTDGSWCERFHNLRSIEWTNYGTHKITDRKQNKIKEKKNYTHTARTIWLSTAVIERSYKLKIEMKYVKKCARFNAPLYIYIEQQTNDGAEQNVSGLIFKYYVHFWKHRKGSLFLSTIDICHKSFQTRSWIHLLHIFHFYFYYDKFGQKKMGTRTSSLAKMKNPIGQSNYHHIDHELSISLDGFAL